MVKEQNRQNEKSCSITDSHHIVHDKDKAKREIIELIEKHEREESLAYKNGVAVRLFTVLFFFWLLFVDKTQYNFLNMLLAFLMLFCIIFYFATKPKKNKKK